MSNIQEGGKVKHKTKILLSSMAGRKITNRTVSPARGY